LGRVRDDADRFAKAGIAVFAVNPARVESHRRYAARLGFPYPILSDPGRKVARAYKAVGLLTVKRTVVGLDARGIVRYCRHGMPPHDEIFRAMT